MAIPLIWKGSVEQFLQPGYPRITDTAQGQRTVLLYRGRFSTLRSQKPTPGQTYSGYDGKIDSVELVPDGAGVSGPGSMTITLTTEEKTYEIDTTMLEKPLERHPRYNDGGAKALTDEDRDKIEAWRNATTASDRALLLEKLSDNAKDFVGKLRLGIEAYMVPAPVARRTTRVYVGFGTGDYPTPENLSKIEAPEGFSGLPADNEWLKTADRIQRQGVRGTIERVEEWTGAKTWDADLYA